MPSNRHSNSSKRTPHRMSHYTSSHYPDEQVLHFYRWKSPPGVMKILSIIVIIMCVAVFVCVASTLAWDYNMDGMGLGGLGMGGMGSMGGMGGMGGGGYYGSNMYGGGVGSGSYGYGGGYGGGYMDPTTGKGFMIAIAAIAFITVLVIFILVVSRQKSAKSARFYLVSIIICAILALLMFIASVVYLVAVNPMAQSSGSMMYSMIWQLCSQFQNQNQAQASALLINQYMYHYCVVDPQEAIAIVLGFLVCIALIIMMVFAIKSRSQINRYGMHRVLWEEPPSTKDGFPHGVEKWVTDVSGEAEAYLNDHNTQIGSSRNYLDQTLDVSKPLYLPGDSDTTSTTIVLKGRARDYDTGAESADELDDADYDSEFPPILNERERLDYKREFDRDLMEYKNLQAELDDINLGLAEVDRELDGLQEGSPQFLDAMEVYTRLKNLKRSSEYQMKKKRSKQLKAKLSLLKRRVNDYDHRGP